MANVPQLMHFFYHSRSEWIDGTARYVRLLRRYVPSSARVLDVGPGDGKGFQHAHHLRGRHVVGVDPDPAIENNTFLQEAVIGRVEKLPFKEGTFDAAVSDYVLEHIQEPRSAACELFRVLKPGGVLLFRTPNLWHYVTLFSYLTPQSLHRLVANWARGIKTASEPFPTTYRCNTCRSVRKYFCPAGFMVAELGIIEAEPMYLQFSAFAFLAGVLYERLVNSHPVFETIRANILGVLRKPDA